MEQEWERTRKTWAIHKGFLRGVAANFRDALDKNWYSQLKCVHTPYCNTTPIQISEHLNSRWCPLDVHTKKHLCIAYYADWDGEQHLTAFGKRLNKCALNSSALQSPTKTSSNVILSKCKPQTTLTRKR
jgi:hypothetical protein